MISLNPYVAWVNNGDNDWFGNNTSSSIVTEKYENGSWSQPEVLYSVLNSVGSLAVDWNNELKIAYSLDTDGDLSTTDDLRVYENGTAVSDSVSAAGNPEYFQHTLYRYSGNEILSSGISATENRYISSDNYKLVNVNGTMAAVFKESDGLYSKVSASYFNNETGCWATPVTLVDNNSAIGAFSADVNNNGEIEVLINNSEVVGTYTDEEPYGASSLMLFGNEHKCDISIGELVYDKETFCENSPMFFDFDITNNGTDVVQDIAVSITDENGEVLGTTYIGDMIAPGETITASTYYIVDQKYASQKVTVTALPEKDTDSDLTKNSQTVTLSYENISVENLTAAVLENDNTVISADIVNYGYQNSDPLTIKLVKDSLKGTVIETKTIDGINSLDMATVSFEVNDTEKNTYFVCIDNHSDDSEFDNTDFIMINRDMIPLIGDANLNGVLDVRDASLVQKYVVKLETLNQEQLTAADANCDGRVDIRDATTIQKKIAGLID